MNSTQKRKTSLPEIKAKRIETEEKKQELELMKINTLSDLVRLAHYYEDILRTQDQEKYQRYIFPKRVFFERLYSIIFELEELEAMIGMRKCKDMVMMQVLYYLQRLHNFEEGDMMHTVLCGPPGCGKTAVGKLIGKIFSRLGLLSKKEKFVIATRGDLIGRFIGETTHKTMNLLNRCKGGVLFLDEAYNLANKGEDERSDSFGREALNLIMQFCSDHKRDFMCIIAGYEKEIEDNFFAINPGAARRFPWRIVIEPYNSEDLRAIFLRKINESEEWKIEEALLKPELFEDKELFSNSGGDIETLYFYCRLVHGINLIANSNKIKYLLTQEDIEGGFKMLRERKQNQNKKKLEAPIGMYS